MKFILGQRTNKYSKLKVSLLKYKEYTNNMNSFFKILIQKVKSSKDNVRKSVTQPIENQSER